MKLVLIRHGESQANKIDKEQYKLLCGRYDCDLTEHGIEQALSLKDNELIKNADAVYCSPLKRTIHTAKLLTDKELHIDERIQERTMGDFDGKALSDLENNPKYTKYFSDTKFMNYRNSFTVSAPNGENYSDVVERVTDFLNEIYLKNYKQVVIVSHAVAIRCLIKVINNLSEEETLKLNIKQCEPVVCDYKY